MKKSLIALAALATAGVVSAQSSVTIYGSFDAGVASERSAAGVRLNKLDSGISSANRLGFRGTEDLGGGLKAGFVAETGFCGDSNAAADGTGNAAAAGKTAVTNNFCSGGNNFMGRQAFVSLDGGFGGVRLGRQYSPAYLVLGSIDPFANGYYSQARNLFDDMGAYGDATKRTANGRVSNAFNYSTPNLAGFSANVLYGFGEVAGNNAGSRVVGFSASYANGPLLVAYAYNKANNAGNTDSRKDNLLGATYDFGVAKAHLGFGRGKNDVTGAGTTQYGDARNALVGLTVPVGSGAFKVSYVRHDDRSAVNADARQVGLGYDYNLSKRTKLYANVARMSNKNTATYVLGNGTYAGTGDRAFALGVAHSF